MTRLSELSDEMKARLERGIKLKFNHETLIGSSDALKSVLYQVEQIAPTDAPVLISGETGTGKELVVREIHRLSSRRDGPFIKINCEAPPSALTSCNVFRQGDRTFSDTQCAPSPFPMTDGATLFLDEIGALPLEFQAGLLNMIPKYTGERMDRVTPRDVPVRIIATTSHNLEQKVHEGKFHEELWHHLNTFPISLPPLRNRLRDIPALVDYFVRRISGQMCSPIQIISRGLTASLQAYDWPGNIRELENLVVRIVMSSSVHDLDLVEELKAPQRALMILPETYMLPKGMEIAGESST